MKILPLLMLAVIGCFAWEFQVVLPVDAIVDGVGDAAISLRLRAGMATNLKRYANHSLGAADWFSAKGEEPYWILDTVEFKTAWHPIGI